MMPLDDATQSDDDVRVTSIDGVATDESTSPLQGIWSSIGPGRVPDRGEGPPTIRPTDLQATMPAKIGDNHTQDGILPADLEKDLLVTVPTNPTNTDSASEALREELRIGVRMLQALEAQFTRAESLIRREEDAATRAEDAITRLGERLESIDDAPATTPSGDVDPAAIERTADDALSRINSAADDVARRLHERLERFVDLDTRLDELDATLQTVERRITRIDEGTEAARTTTTQTAPMASSGSLTVEPRSGMTASTTPATKASESVSRTEDTSDQAIAVLARLQLLIDRGDEVRRELRRDLEAICTASATLVEVVEQAASTERMLRGTLEHAEPEAIARTNVAETRNGTVASILRRLADEFEANPTSTSPAASTRVMPAELTSMRPIELDVSPGDGMPTRREPLETGIDAESTSA